ncbi:hypothetical protein HELRODRAFT_174897 [Helobdella robusta]|uniref:N-terminal Ras-GEF domain-containing protein n=1 Tax=Helobdella robusta TaxID=6412 RepID=T1F8L3_HELRO|nr:hypothetical protein HELRODRAFT_174897 [Helobdella robusta]ESO01342.1 hypothetical protein HELRODRAFT_174897 [Helobdella robusta]
MTCIDNLHYNELLFCTLSDSSSVTLPQSMRCDPKLFKDEVDIKFSKSLNSCKVPQIRHASVDKLLERLTDLRFLSIDFLNTFLLTYRVFATGSMIVEALRNVYRNPECCNLESIHQTSSGNDRSCNGSNRQSFDNDDSTDSSSALEDQQQQHLQHHQQYQLHHPQQYYDWFAQQQQQHQQQQQQQTDDQQQQHRVSIVSNKSRKISIRSEGAKKGVTFEDEYSSKVDGNCQQLLAGFNHQHHHIDDQGTKNLPIPATTTVTSYLIPKAPKLAPIASFETLSESIDLQPDDYRDDVISAQNRNDLLMVHSVSQQFKSKPSEFNDILEESSEDHKFDDEDDDVDDGEDEEDNKESDELSKRKFTMLNKQHSTSLQETLHECHHREPLNIIQSKMISQQLNIPNQPVQKIKGSSSSTLVPSPSNNGSVFVPMISSRVAGTPKSAKPQPLTLPSLLQISTYDDDVLGLKPNRSPVIEYNPVVTKSTCFDGPFSDEKRDDSIRNRLIGKKNMFLSPLYASKSHHIKNNQCRLSASTHQLASLAVPNEDVHGFNGGHRTGDNDFNYNYQINALALSPTIFPKYSLSSATNDCMLLAGLKRRRSTSPTSFPWSDQKENFTDNIKMETSLDAKEESHGQFFKSFKNQLLELTNIKPGTAKVENFKKEKITIVQENEFKNLNGTDEVHQQKQQQKQQQKSSAFSFFDKLNSSKSKQKFQLFQRKDSSASDDGDKNNADATASTTNLCMKIPADIKVRRHSALNISEPFDRVRAPIENEPPVFKKSHHHKNAHHSARLSVSGQSRNFPVFRKSSRSEIASATTTVSSSSHLQVTAHPRSASASAASGALRKSSHRSGSSQSKRESMPNMPYPQQQHHHHLHHQHGYHRQSVGATSLTGTIPAHHASLSYKPKTSKYSLYDQDQMQCLSPRSSCATVSECLAPATRAGIVVTSSRASKRRLCQRVKLSL